jgi:hypothetical protein
MLAKPECASKAQKTSLNILSQLSQLKEKTTSQRPAKGDDIQTRERGTWINYRYILYRESVLLAYVVSVLHVAALHRCVAAHCDPCAPCVVPESYCLGQPQLCGRRTVFMSIFISVRHTSAKPFPRWTVAFVASSINRNSGQLTAVVSKVGRCVR